MYQCITLAADGRVADRSTIVRPSPSLFIVPDADFVPTQMRSAHSWPAGAAHVIRHRAQTYVFSPTHSLTPLSFLPHLPLSPSSRFPPLLSHFSFHPLLVFPHSLPRRFFPPTTSHWRSSCTSALPSPATPVPRTAPPSYVPLEFSFISTNADLVPTFAQSTSGPSPWPSSPCASALRLNVRPPIPSRDYRIFPPITHAPLCTYARARTARPMLTPPS